MSGGWKDRIACKQAIIDELTASQEKRHRCIEDAHRQKAESDGRIAKATADEVRLERELEQLDASIADAEGEGRE